MGEGKPGGNAGQSQAQANVSQSTIDDQAQWNTGTPKSTGDAITQGQYPGASDARADAGQDTSPAQQVSSTTDPRPEGLGGNAPDQSDRNPSTYGSMKEGLPASGAATDPDETASPDRA